jgi:hypothetical protein
MLRFSPEQELAVNQVRERFNSVETAYAATPDVGLIGNASPIPLDAWRRVDTRARDIQRDVLVIFNRLANASQTPVSIADLVSFYPQISDSGEVQVTMDGRHPIKADAANLKYAGTPVPVFTSHAQWGWRQMETIRKGGGMIDTKTIGNNQRKVAEKLEDMALNGLGIVHAGMTIYGLRNFPQRNTATHGLTLSAATGAQWVTAFKSMVDQLVGDNAFGKVTVFMNWSDHVYASFTEFAAGYPKTILQRLQEISQIAEIVPASKVPANELIGIADLGSGNWGSVLNAMPMVTRPKNRANPEDDYVFGVMAAAATQFESDYDGRSSIAHLTTA